MEFRIRVVGKVLFRPGRLALLGLVTAAFFAMAGCASYSTYRRVVLQPVTVDQIVTMSKAGLAPEEIVRKMRAARTVYRLTAAQLAQLRTEGVADKVINYMQHTYLAAVRRSSRLEDWRYWRHRGDSYWYGGEAFGWPDNWYWPDDNFGDEGENE